MNEPGKTPANPATDSGDHRSAETLSHVDARGTAKMVDVSAKSATFREATAEAFCLLNTATATAIRDNQHKKGDVFAVARVAGIQAAKKTADLIPLCHTVPLSKVSVEFDWDQASRICIRSTASCMGQTGVEMEALCAASVAALTIYDMCKAMDPGIEIQSVRLVSKSGGKSDFRRSKSE